ncbi:hypothetical protein KC363_g7314 [Hortaea werneckii]|uniref:Uncharacterized protein n=1 Tax=Hortaea werneckii TaxID=91943 RepID=A0A3M7F8P6_HORWE|nr:hypothetical protein KC363_g7314 [Hortaea werneckii]RMY84881.1 hypothetical protein D0861_06731 [Hortaea werneckii]
MAEDQKRMDDAVVVDENITKDLAPAKTPANDPNPDVVMTEAPPTSITKLQKTAERCKRRADHLLLILENWWDSAHGVLICARFEELREALEDEKNYTSEAMAELVLETRDVFTKSQNKQIALSEDLPKVYPSYTESGRTKPEGFWELLEIQERVIESMERKIESITSPPGSYEWRYEEE